MTIPRVLAVLAAASHLACPATARAVPQAPPLPPALAEDPVMEAMLGELARTAALKLDDYPAPYYVALVIKEREAFELAGKLGAVYQRSTARERKAAVDVRVGDYALDSSEDEELDWVQDGVYEPSSIVALGEDGPTIRHTLWLLADLRYKQALASYLKLKGQRVYRPSEPRKRPSFSPAPPIALAQPTVALAYDEVRWTRLVTELGTLLAADSRIFDAEISLSFEVVTRWFVNTEGARIRSSTPQYGVHVMGYTRAEDGMLIDHSVDFYGRAERELPDDATLRHEVRRVVEHLAALRSAPLLDPYTGPAILDPRATGVFFHEVLGHRLEGHRQHGDEEGQTFTKHLGRSIMPGFLSIVDDPTRRRQGAVELNGFYQVDDEGVAAVPVTLVDRGVLKGFLQYRRPVPGFVESNGHGRAQGVQRPVARMSNLIVTAHAPVTPETLRRRLLEEVRRQGKPFGLIIRDLSGGSTNTSAYGYQAFKGEARLVYKVDAETGKETLVRGVDIVGTPLTTLGNILAADDRIGIFNGFCGAESGMVPVSTVAPATLFAELEVQRSGKARSKGPLLAPPMPSRAPSQNR